MIYDHGTLVVDGIHTSTNRKCFLPSGWTRWAAISVIPAKRNHLAWKQKQVSLSARSSRCLLLPWWPLEYASPSDYSLKPYIKKHQKYREMERGNNIIEAKKKKKIPKVIQLLDLYTVITAFLIQGQSTEIHVIKSSSFQAVAVY